MKINEHTRLIGNKVILVPYEKHHVPKYDCYNLFILSVLLFQKLINCLRYHKWMQSEELRLLTASEALTLEKEYEMQSSWRNDEDSKVSFIILVHIGFFNSLVQYLVFFFINIYC